MKVLCTAVFFLLVMELVRPLKVSIVDNMGRDNKILHSYPTLKRMGIIPKAWPQISKAFKEWEEAENDFD